MSDRLAPDRLDLFDTHLCYIDMFVKNYAHDKKLKSDVDMGDLICAAQVGLWSAAKKFDFSANNVSFWTSANPYIRKEMLSHLKALDRLPHDVKECSGDSKGYAEFAVKPFSTIDPFLWASEGSVECEDIGESLYAAQLLVIFKEALETRLDDISQEAVAYLFYYEGMNFESISEVVSLSVERVSQIMIAVRNRIESVFIEHGVYVDRENRRFTCDQTSFDLDRFEDAES